MDRRTMRESKKNAKMTALPRISIVTPSYNQGPYLEHCIQSILDQDYSDIEYIIIDGGSTDGSKEIIEAYAHRLAYWQSQSDQGQYWAIQEGFRRCTGDIMTWLNADDIFDPYTFKIVGAIFQQRSDIDWLTGRPANIDKEKSRFSVRPNLPRWSRKKYLRKEYHHPFIQQEGTFWRRSLWQRAGAKMDTTLSLAGDLELWTRFFRSAQLHAVDYGLGFYRVHGENRALLFMDQYMQEAERVIEREIKRFQSEPHSRLDEAPLPISKKQIGEYLSLSKMLMMDTSKAVAPASTDPLSTRSKQQPNVTARLEKMAAIDMDRMSCSTGEELSNPADCMVSIILPTKDRAQGLYRTLDSLSDAMQDIPYEILLYADQESEHIAQCLKKKRIRKFFYDLEVFGDQDSFSWSKLMNHGFSQASGQWIMYGSDDIVLYPGCIKNAILETIRERLGEKIGGVTFLHRNTAETYNGFFTDFGYDTLNGDKPFINFGLISAKAFAKTNGFDEKFRFFWADVDICAQIQSHGYTIIPSIGSMVDHHNVLECDQKENRIALFDTDTEYFYTKWQGAALFGGKNPLDKVRFVLAPDDSRKIIHKISSLPINRVSTVPGDKTRVVIDGVIFQLQSGKVQGISRVWRSLISELVKQIPNSDIIVLQREGFPVPIEGVNLHTVPAFQLAGEDTLDEDDEMLRKVCREIGADLFISTYYTRAPGLANVAMIHDLIPEIHQFDLSEPEWVAKQRTIETADAFICVSNVTRKDLVRFYPQIASRPKVVAHNGLDACFKRPSENEISRIRRKLKLDGPYVMLVGNRHGYKNGVGMLAAMARMKGHYKPTVLCIGGEKPTPSIYSRLNEKLDMRYAGQLSDQDLVAAYGGAMALMFPSQYEGFGLPVIEAMACGCPVIAHPSSAVIEIGGDAAYLADLSSADAIVKAFEVVLGTARRDTIIQKGYDCAAHYDWGASARRWAEVMGDLEDKPSILLTAVVSTYDAAEFIRGCLEDLENQTLFARSEIIVVDSASKQSEAAVVRDFQKRCANIKYIRTPYRENVYAAWNRGIKFAVGKYVTNANTDDRHRRDAFEEMVGVLENNDSVVLVYADVVKTQTPNETFDQCTPTGAFRWHDWDRQTLLTQGCFIGPQPVWRKKVHEEYGYFNDSYEVSSDFEFWLRISQTHDFYHIAKPLGLYLDRPDSIEHANGDKKVQENSQILARYRKAAEKQHVIKRKETSETNEDAEPVVSLQDNRPIIAVRDHTAGHTETGLLQGGNIMTSPNIILKAVQLLDEGGQQEAVQWCMGKLQNDFPDNPELHDRLADMAFKSGDMDKALIHFEQAARLSPVNAMYQKNLGDFYYVVNKDAEKALMLYENVVELEPENIEMLTMAGHIAISLHRYSEARSYYHRVLSLDPNNTEIQAIMDKVSQHPGAIPANTLSADEIHANAVAKANQGDPKGAIELLVKLLERESYNALVHNDLGVLYYECGEKTHALTHYQKAAELQPEEKLFQKNLADFYWVEMADSEKAMAKYIDVLKLDPQDVEAMLSCGQICMALGKHDDARDFIQTVLELEPWNENARQMFDQQAATITSSDAGQGASSFSLPSQEDIAVAASVEEIDKMEKKIAQDPDNAMVHNHLGILYYENGHAEKALQAYMHAVQLEPDDANYLKNLADFYFIEQGRTEEAMALYLKVLEKNPKDIEALVASGMVCATLAKLEDAKFFYHRALEIDPGNETARRALTQLNSNSGGEGFASHAAAC